MATHTVETTASFTVFPQSKLLQPTDADVRSLKDQLDHRIREGHGETMFEIGIEGNFFVYVLCG